MKTKLSMVALATALSLWAGAGIAAGFSYSTSGGAQVSYSDAACSGFTMDAAGAISCTPATPPDTTADVGACSFNPVAPSVQAGSSVNVQANCANATSWSWTVDGTTSGVTAQTLPTPTTLTEGTHTLAVTASNAKPSSVSASVTVTVTAAPVTPPPQSGTCGTAAANVDVLLPGAVDSIARKTFDNMFDTIGVTLDSKVDAGRVKSYGFTNGFTGGGSLSVTRGNWGGGYKYMWVSECPGGNPISNSCKGTGEDINLAWSTDGRIVNWMVSCNLGTDPSKVWYLNITNTNTSTYAGYVMKNSR